MTAKSRKKLCPAPLLHNRKDLPIRVQNKERQRHKQIPFGDDKQKNNNKRREQQQTKKYSNDNGEISVASAVMRRSDPPDAVVQVAPLICVEVLSPSDSLVSMQGRVADYRRMGVGHVWVVDPIGRHAYVASERGFEQPGSGEFTVPGTAIRIVLAEVFAELDEMMTQGG
jgi:Uma2 family endonuclease